MKTCPVCGAEWSADLKFCPNDGTTLRSMGGADLIGSVIGGNYHIEKKLGEGGMGAVYLGKHVKMGRKSAIKVMTQSMASDAEAIARFKREATNAARIAHPNVCAIYDFGETPDGTIFLAMEFIEGGSLNDVLQEQGALPLERATTILEQTADALSAAHDLEIVHRDLKPDNIMLTQARGGDMVKVVDFGIAKAMGGEEGQKVTKTGLVVGTPEYMSPEQLSGDVLDGRSDIYSLALVYYRMITGTLPFQADSAQETMIKRLTDDPLPLAVTAPDAGFPEALQACMDRALQRFPGDRYESAVAFAKAVRQATRGAPAPAAVDSEGATQLISAQQATQRLARTEVAGAVKQRSVAPTAAPTPATPMPQAAATHAPPKKKAPVIPIAAAIVFVAAAGVTANILLRNGNSEATGSDPLSVTTRTDSGTPTPQDSRLTAGGAQNPSTRRGGGETKAGGASDSAGGTPPTGGEQRAVNPAGGQPAVPALDIEVVRADLDRIFDDIMEPGTRAGARERAQGYFARSDLPTVERAKAAYLIGAAYVQDDKSTDACRWYQQARQLDPTNQTIQTLMSTAGCTT